MKKATINQSIYVLGIDLAKSGFQLHGVDQDGKQVCKKALSREKLKEFIVKLPPCRVGMEACGSSHYWARLLGLMDMT